MGFSEVRAPASIALLALVAARTGREGSDYHSPRQRAEAMTIICLDWETAHHYGEAWISHHRLRHRLFVERQAWQVPTYNRLEYDQFDTPAAKYLVWLDGRGQARGVARLIPTTRPYMVEALWPDLVAGDLPHTAAIWEATRFGCDRNLDPMTRRAVVSELICGCQEYGLANGIESYLGVMPTAIFKHVIAGAGCPVTYAGPTRRMERHEIAAAYIDVSPQTLAEVRKRGSLRHPVLHVPLPMAA